ncbi:MAG: rhodanese-like domain-containing protein [Spirochaetia bacterium]
MKKRLLSVLVVLSLLSVSGFLFLGCQEDEESASQEQEQEQEQEQTASKAEVLQGAIDSHFNNLSANGNDMIDQEDFINKVKEGDDMLILDIRRAEDYEEGHVEGAVNVPWGPALAKSLDFMPTDKPVMIYCYTGQTANQANGVFNFAGVDAKSVKFGFNLGISKVDGYEDVITTSESEFSGTTGIEVDPALQDAFETYFEDLEDVSGTMYASNIISEEDLKKIVDEEDDNIHILSIRQEEDYNEGHIPGADLISWGDGMQSQFANLPTSKKIVVYCYTGQTAGQAVAGLRVLGYDAVSLKGGFGTPANEPQGWSNQDYPVVSE